MNDPYLTLGIHEEVNDAEVSAAYHRKLRQYPPEKFPETFAAISEAYETIRTEYDRIKLHLIGPVPKAEHLVELAAFEEAEAPVLDRLLWQQAALSHWFTRKL